MVTEIYPKINHAPTISIEKGQAFSEEQTPYFLANNSKVIVAFDISGQLSLPDPKDYDLILVFQKNGIEYTFAGRKIEFNSYSSITDSYFKGVDKIIINPDKLIQYAMSLILVIFVLLLIWNMFIRLIFLLILVIYTYVVLDLLSKKSVLGLRQLLIIGVYSLIPTTYIIFVISFVTHTLKFGTSSLIIQAPLWVIIITGLYLRYSANFSQRKPDEEDKMVPKFEITNAKQVNIIEDANNNVINITFTDESVPITINKNPKNAAELVKSMQAIQTSLAEIQQRLTDQDQNKVIDAEACLKKGYYEAIKPNPDKSRIRTNLEKTARILKDIEPYASLASAILQIASVIPNIL